MQEVAKNNLNDLIRITEINGDNIVKILSEMDDDQLNDYLWCWRQRISEEIERRITTGRVIPFTALSWCIRGVGWEEEIPWEKIPQF